MTHLRLPLALALVAAVAAVCVGRLFDGLSGPEVAGLALAAAAWGAVVGVWGGRRQ
jgi:hypothetical protein